MVFNSFFSKSINQLIDLLQLQTKVANISNKLAIAPLCSNASQEVQDHHCMWESSFPFSRSAARFSALSVVDAALNEKYK